MDFAFAAESLEHAVRIPQALMEISRVTEQGGTLVVIDKAAACRGTLDAEAWEQWFDPDELVTVLHCAGFEGHVVPDVPYDGRDGRDGLFFAIVAKKL